MSTDYARKAIRYTAMVSAFALLAVFLTSCQDTFVYHPSRAAEGTLVEQAQDSGLAPWPEAGDRRMGWYASAAAPPDDQGVPSDGQAAPPDGQGVGDGPAGEAETRGPARALVFHGNAGHSLHRQYLARGLQSSDTGPGWDVYLFEYPGYGSRDGSPGEEAIMNAAAEALERLLSEDEERPVYLVGESLGSGVAAKLAAGFPESVPGVFLITPFTNLEDVGAATFPRSLVRAILRDRFDAEAVLQSYDGRVAVLIAGQDEVVTSELGEELYESFSGEKRKWVQEEASHNTLDYTPGAGFWNELTGFLLGR